MRLAVKHDVFVDFVRHDVATPVAQQVGKRVEVLLRQDCAGRVVREIQHQQSRLFR